MSVQNSRVKIATYLVMLFTSIASPSLADRAALYEQNGNGTNGIMD